MKRFLWAVLGVSLTNVAPARTTEPSAHRSSSSSAVASVSPLAVAPSTSPTTNPSAVADSELAPPRATASIIGPNPSYVGQMVQVEVELLRDDRQTDKAAPFFPEIEVNDAIALLSTSAPPPDTKSLNGVSFLGQKRRYLIFPQVPGGLVVPPVHISIPGANGQFTTLQTEPLQITASIPQGAAGRLPFIAQNVKLERTIEGDLNSLRVGDAFTVSLQLSAEQTDPVMLPSLKLPEIPGLSSYPSEASTTAHADRGIYKAQRVEQTTYVASEWGFRELPAVSVFWLDPATGNYAEATATALSFRVRANPSLGAGCVGGRGAVLRLGGSIGFLLMLGFVSLSWWRRFSIKRAQRALVPKTQEEKAAFLALKAAAASGRDGPALTALYRWLPFAIPGAITLSELRDRSQSQPISETTSALEQRLATSHGQGNAVDLIEPLVQFRKSHKQTTNKEALPALNE